MFLRFSRRLDLFTDLSIFSHRLTYFVFLALLLLFTNKTILFQLFTTAPSSFVKSVVWSTITTLLKPMRVLSCGKRLFLYIWAMRRGAITRLHSHWMHSKVQKQRFVNVFRTLRLILLSPNQFLSLFNIRSASQKTLPNIKTLPHKKNSKNMEFWWARYEMISF